MGSRCHPIPYRLEPNRPLPALNTTRLTGRRRRLHLWPPWRKWRLDFLSPVYLGESWQHSAVVLAWNIARRGAADTCDGQNVILHGLAHQLDQEDGAADGKPELE